MHFWDPKRLDVFGGEEVCFHRLGFDLCAQSQEVGIRPEQSVPKSRYLRSRLSAKSARTPCGEMRLFGLFISELRGEWDA